MIWPHRVRFGGSALGDAAAPCCSPCVALARIICRARPRS